MKKIALIFPGQGAQYVGMGKNLLVGDMPTALMQKVQDVLGFDLKKLCLEGPLEELTQTNNSQVALYTCGYICYQLIKEQLPEDFQPSFVAGLSLGEFTALAVAGVYSFEDGLRLVRMRGELMQNACETTPGTMASIMGSERDIVQAWIDECVEQNHVVATANLNCPGQVVISGTVEAVSLVSKKAEVAGNRVIPLNVSGAFHSPLMESARVGLAEVIEKISFYDPKIPVISNYDAQIKTTAKEIKVALVEQMVNSVLWQDSVERMIFEGVGLFVELGCGRVLKGLMRRINKKIDCISIEKEEDITSAILKIVDNLSL